VISFSDVGGECIEQAETWEQIKMSQNPGSAQEAEEPYGKKKAADGDRILIALRRAGREVAITHKKMGCRWLIGRTEKSFKFSLKTSSFRPKYNVETASPAP